MKISAVTSNQGKLREFRAVLAPLGFEVEHSTEDCDEIQADTLREVVLSCLAQLKGRGREDIIIDDSGLFIDAFQGFPGVYSAYALKTLGVRGVLKLMEGVEERDARFECCIGATVGGEDIVVSGRCDGTIALKPSGSEGFGFDPIFIPAGHSQTFAEISIEEKSRISHRGRALQAFTHEIGRRKE